MALFVILGIISFLALYIVSRGHRKPPKGAQYPPGPPGKPFIGNLLDIPPVNSWIKFRAWADQYGSIFRLNIAGRENYIVSTEKVANDLLRGRGTIYSGREQLPSAAALLSNNLRPLLLPHNQTWREGRKLMHLLTMPSAATSYQPAQLLESSRMLYKLIKEPERYEEWFALYASGLIFRLAFGRAIESDDPHLERIQEVVHHVTRIASPGAYLVDTFPIMMKIPKRFAPFRQELEYLHKKELELFRELLYSVRDNEKAPSCWERTFIERQGEINLSEDEGAYVIGTLFEAGSSTTAEAMMSVLLALVHHPTWQHRLEEEVDRVVGDDRLPTFQDMPDLPIVRAVVKETLRWRPVTAGGVPHQSDKDDVYEGIFLPAGTNVHPNQWAIHREAALYPDPDAFNPDRWLSPSFPTYREPLSTYPNLQNFSAFGFGRRICPGLNIAERSLNILTARIAWACHVSKTTDVNGNEVEVPLYDYIGGFNVRPRWFPFDLRPRKGRGVLVEQEWKREREDDNLGSLHE